ncbi:MAG: redoxin domain-containing protein [Acidobacteriia bacterium]|nr:redoxin domain-containing protein [Terriglobia bacterium]
MPEDRVRGVIESELASVGTAAPDFELPALIAGVKKPLRLSAYRGQKNVVLAFYPYNWQEASAKQLIGYQAERPRVLASNAETVAVTVDSVMNTTTWEREIGPFDFPICADFWPHGEVCARYGVLRESGREAGASERAVLVIDRDGRIAFRKVYGLDEVPPMEEVLSMLGKL